MEKAFDLQNLKSRLAAKGLDIAEDLLKVVAGEILDWTGESCALHENKVLQIVSPLPMLVKPMIINQLDKIDGKEN